MQSTVIGLVADIVLEVGARSVLDGAQLGNAAGSAAFKYLRLRIDLSTRRKIPLLLGDSGDIRGGRRGGFVGNLATSGALQQAVVDAVKRQFKPVRDAQLVIHLA